MGGGVDLNVGMDGPEPFFPADVKLDTVPRYMSVRRVAYIQGVKLIIVIFLIFCSILLVFPYLLARNSHMVGDVREDGGLHEEASLAHPTATTLELGALLATRVDQLQHLAELLVVDLKPRDP